MSQPRLRKFLRAEYFTPNSIDSKPSRAYLEQCSQRLIKELSKEAHSVDRMITLDSVKTTLTKDARGVRIAIRAETETRPSRGIKRRKRAEVQRSSAA